MRISSSSGPGVTTSPVNTVVAPDPIIGEDGGVTVINGELVLGSSSGVDGQVLTSQGPGFPPVWAEGGGVVSLPESLIGFGSDLDTITSSSLLSFVPSTSSSTSSVLTAGELTLTTIPVDMSGPTKVVELAGADVLLISPTQGVSVSVGVDIDGALTATAANFSEDVSCTDASVAGGHLSLGLGSIQQGSGNVTGVAATPYDLFALSTTSADPVVISTAETPGVKVIVVVSTADDRQMATVDVLVDGTTVYLDTSGELETNPLGTFSAVVSDVGDPLQFVFTPTNSGDFYFRLVVIGV
jgi:hypothetical protein